jgi:hypothetical protein
MKWDPKSREPKIGYFFLNTILIVGFLGWGGVGALLFLTFFLIGEQDIGGKWFCGMLVFALASIWVPEASYPAIAVYLAGWTHANVVLFKKKRMRRIQELASKAVAQPEQPTAEQV